MEEMRKQFENWVGHQYGGDDFSFNSEDETYDSCWVQGAWEIWQASRAALVVDLSDMHLLACDKKYVTEALPATGITVKGEGNLISIPDHVLDKKWRDHFGKG